MTVSLETANVRKVFNRRPIFSGVNLRLSAGDSLSIVGRNGAGKSTLVKVLLGVLAPSGGSIVYREGNEIIPSLDWFTRTGLVSPYLQLYDEFSAWENLDFIRHVRGVKTPDRNLQDLLERVNLGSRAHDPVRTFSSGMKQRLKYACALVHKPPVLVFDEPTANLDTEGSAIVREFVEEQKKTGIMIIATNEPEERGWCTTELDLDVLKGGTQ